MKWKCARPQYYSMDGDHVAKKGRLCWNQPSLNVNSKVRHLKKRFILYTGMRESSQLIRHPVPCDLGFCSCEMGQKLCVFHWESFEVCFFFNGRQHQQQQQQRAWVVYGNVTEGVRNGTTKSLPWKAGLRFAPALSTPETSKNSPAVCVKAGMIAGWVSCQHCSPWCMIVPRFEHTRKVKTLAGGSGGENLQALHFPIYHEKYIALQPLVLIWAKSEGI